jgi:hypothetical protein
MSILANTLYSMELSVAGWIIVTVERKARSLQQRDYVTGVPFLFRSVEDTQFWGAGKQMMSLPLRSLIKALKGKFGADFSAHREGCT